MRTFLLWVFGVLKDEELSELRTELTAARKSIKTLKYQVSELHSSEESLGKSVESKCELVSELRDEITSLEALNLGYAVQIRKLQAQEEVLKFEIYALNESHKRIGFLAEASRREAELEIALKSAEIELASATGIGKFAKEKPNGNIDQSGGFE